MHVVDSAERNVARRRAEGEEVAVSCVDSDVMEKAWCEARAEIDFAEGGVLYREGGVDALVV